MRCSIARRLISAYRDGALPESQRAAMAGHLDACESCRVELVRLNMALGTLGVLPLDEPTRTLHKRLMDRVHAIEGAREADVWDRALLDPQVRASAGLLPVDHEHGDPKGNVTLSTAPSVRRRAAGAVIAASLVGLVLALLIGLSSPANDERTPSVVQPGEPASIASADDPVLSTLLVEHHARLAELARQARAIKRDAPRDEAGCLAAVLVGADLGRIESAIEQRLNATRVADAAAVREYLADASRLCGDARELERTLVAGEQSTDPRTIRQPATDPARARAFDAPMPPVTLLSMIESREQEIRVVLFAHEAGKQRQIAIGAVTGWPSTPFDVQIIRQAHHDDGNSPSNSSETVHEANDVEIRFDYAPTLAARQYSRAFDAYAAGRFEDAAWAFATYRALPGRKPCADLAAYWQAMALRRSGHAEAAWPILSYLAQTGDLGRLADPVDALLLLRAVHTEVTALVTQSTRYKLEAPTGATLFPDLATVGAIRFGVPTPYTPTPYTPPADDIGAGAIDPVGMSMFAGATNDHFYPALVHLQTGENRTAVSVGQPGTHRGGGSTTLQALDLQFVTTPTDTSRLGQFHLLERELLRVARAGDVDRLLGRLAPRGSLLVQSPRGAQPGAIGAVDECAFVFEVMLDAANGANAQVAWNVYGVDGDGNGTAYAPRADQEVVTIRRYNQGPGVQAVAVGRDAHAFSGGASYGVAGAPAGADVALYYLDVLTSLQGRAIAYEGEAIELKAARWQLNVEPTEGGSGLWAYGPWARESSALDAATSALKVAEMQVEATRLRDVALALTTVLEATQALADVSLSEAERAVARARHDQATADLQRLAPSQPSQRQSQQPQQHRR